MLAGGASLFVSGESSPSPSLGSVWVAEAVYRCVGASSIVSQLAQATSGVGRKRTEPTSAIGNDRAIAWQIVEVFVELVDRDRTGPGKMARSVLTARPNVDQDDVARLHPITKFVDLDGFDAISVIEEVSTQAVQLGDVACSDVLKP